MHSLIRNFLKLPWIIIFFYLTACSQPVLIVTPINLSHANQSASASFTAGEAGDYLFALLFVKKEEYADIMKQITIWGDSNNEGTPIPVHLQILKDGKVFIENDFITTGVQWGRGFYHEGRRLNTAVRLVDIITLPPGNYTTKITTLVDTEAFSGIEGYFEVGYYKPKH
ncbi:hypothetical protein JET64_01580 [Pseudomonas putida]|nr:hypothetical protein [Pseudomonas putida]